MGRVFKTSEEMGKDGNEDVEIIYSRTEGSKIGLCAYRMRPVRELEEREAGDDPPCACTEVPAEQQLPALWDEAGQPITAFSKAALGAVRQH